MKNSESNVWYAKGLPFSCTGCGKCCTGSPGVVWISEEEIEALASSFTISVAEFEKKYVRLFGNKKALMEKKPEDGAYDCIFLEGKRCSIYELRPKQCKTFPWWSENLSSPEAWEEAGKSCEGINLRDAPVISPEEIKKNLC